MPSRLVNAVFFEPNQKFIVVYQNGSLWQLPRMKIDIVSWRNRKSYQGSKKSLYLMRDQKIKGLKLSQIIPTQELPINLANINLPKFEAWWSMNGYIWLEKKAKEKKKLAKNNLTTDNTSIDSITNPALQEEKRLNVNVRNTVNVNARATKTDASNNPNSFTEPSHTNDISKNNIGINTKNNNAEKNNKASSNPKVELSFLAKRHIAKQKELEEQRNKHNHLAIKRRTEQTTKISRETLEENRKIRAKYSNTTNNNDFNNNDFLGKMTDSITDNMTENNTNNTNNTNNNTRENPETKMNTSRQGNTMDDNKKKVNEDIFDSFLTDLDNS